jgi:hypothetical protein
MAHRIFVFFICSCCAFLNGCGRYDVTVNQQPVYQPKPLPALLTITDANLAVCVEQTMRDRQIVQADDLTQLACSYGGIENLAGMEQFSKLQQLDLSHNMLSRVEELFKLPRLRDLRLEGNPDLSCADLNTLATLREDLKITRPQHCR